MKTNYVSRLFSKRTLQGPECSPLSIWRSYVGREVVGQHLVTTCCFYSGDDPVVQFYNPVCSFSAVLLFSGKIQKIPEIHFTQNLQKCNVLPINSVAKGLPQSLFPLNGYTMFQVSEETNIFAVNMLAKMALSCILIKNIVLLTTTTTTTLSFTSLSGLCLVNLFFPTL